MDSIFRLERNREGCSWAGRGGTRPFAVQPCPVDPLLRAYLPEWVVGFLSDLWKRDRSVALIGSFPAYGRGLVKSFNKIEIVMSDEVFTLFFEYLKRHNAFKMKDAPEFALLGLYDVFHQFPLMSGKRQSFRNFGQESSKSVLAETVYLLEPMDISSPPIRTEISVISNLIWSRLEPGHEQKTCVMHQLGARTPNLVRPKTLGCRESFHTSGYPRTRGPAFAMSLLCKAQHSQHQVAIYSFEYYGLASSGSVFNAFAVFSLPALGTTLNEDVWSGRTVIDATAVDFSTVSSTQNGSELVGISSLNKKFKK
ncbi:uncharacterized protein LOC111717043 isoform X3 [Eurytemora carolleeae]|uniref:uncharacterized protein LOC111717043 isoform X3 n=1 Tax=Eurytemora carolleeae TaxID=1294199 RepID=UPI000C78FAA6|nr:uncharacterized protein LOC111717043 isoform X3 [Eurytemora carolleeae]|eukprot:XP_023348331.1 uncharacterized protein LOC111717043 isoform X3 [Eurytemora affinis]